MSGVSGECSPQNRENSRQLQGKFHAGPAFAEEGSHAEARFIPAAEALLRRKGRDEADAGVKSAAYELQPYPLRRAAPAIGSAVAMA